MHLVGSYPCTVCCVLHRRRCCIFVSPHGVHLDAGPAPQGKPRAVHSCLCFASLTRSVYCGYVCVWLCAQPLTPLSNAFFGHTVSLSGDSFTIAIGSPGDASGARVINPTGAPPPQRDNSGAVFVFNKNTTAMMVQQAFIKSFNSRIGAFIIISSVFNL